MTEDQIKRLNQLQEQWCPSQLFRELHGLDLENDTRLLGFFRTWSKRFRKKDQVERQHDTCREFDRHTLETFLQVNGLVSFKWGAVKLGMDEDSLKKIIEALEGDALLVSSPSSSQVIEERLVRNLHKQFPELRYQIFSSHSAKCSALHAQVRETLGIDVKPLRCVTSEILTPQDPDYAASFDAITSEPIGQRYQVWLDFKKPINLNPDCCSLKLYAQNSDQLNPFLMRGEAPNVPEGLAKAVA